MRHLPTEILDLILEQTTRPTLCDVLRASRFLHTLALRTLYEAPRDGPCDSWPAISTRQQIVLLRTLARNQAHHGLPKPNTHVRFLRLDFADHAVSPNLVRLIHRALRTTPGLRELDIQFSAFDNYHKFSWCLTGCTFKLHKFKTSINYDQKLVDFLATQPFIKELSLNGLLNDPMPLLPPNALPRLHTLRNAHVDPNAIAQFIAGRPVEAASLTLPSDNWQKTLDALTSGSAPLQRVTLLCLDSVCADTLVAELAGRLPNLLAFHAVFFLSLMPHVSPTYLRHSCVILTLNAGKAHHPRQ